MDRYIRLLKIARDEIEAAKKSSSKDRLYSIDHRKVAESSLIKAIDGLLNESPNDELKNKLEGLKKNPTKEIIDEIINLLKKESYFSLNVRLPSTIKDEIMFDYNDMIKCYNNRLYRSSLILAARILEVSLHRKYYEATGRDILETNPDIGLGKLIAKLSENNVRFDPGLMNQIHLLNSLRIHSVHRKQDIFKPSKKQAEAVILLTIDLLEKIFGDKA